MKKIYLLLILFVATTLHAQQNVPAKNFPERKKELFQRQTLKPEVKPAISMSNASKKAALRKNEETTPMFLKSSIQPGFQKASQNANA
ncbi:MAG: hypothetical protein LBH32_06215, partial [Dysgonamonadaceae bacterium]|nr:hypothetical protein [Dysgonamonadaceae bacterium]